MNLKPLFIIFILLITNLVNGQHIKLSEVSKISLITIDPGKQLVDSFGHSAIRVEDDSLGIDLAFNYGMFDFNKPHFYTNFAKGKLEYELGVANFSAFLSYYQEQNRGLKEQVLNLSHSQRQEYFEFLQENAKPENKTYLYDFFFDNCATKLRDVSNIVLDDKIEFDYSFMQDKQLTFRNLIHKYLDKQAWGKFGIDLALGSVIDKNASFAEHQFLPDYVYSSFDNSSLDGRPIVLVKNDLFIAKNEQKEPNYFSPFIVFSLVGLLVLIITIKDIRRKKRTKWLDFTIFLTTGTIGLIVLLLWFATNHTATANNFNFLWAFMPNLFIAFILLKKELSSFINKYMLFLISLLVICLVLFIFKVQVFSSSLIPIGLMLLIRYCYLYKKSV